MAEISNRKLNIKNNKKGFILILSIFIISLLLLLSTYILSFTMTELKISSSQETASQAYYLAESAMAKAIWKINNDTIWKNSFEMNENWSINITEESPLYDNASYEITIENNGLARAKITTKGKIKKGNSTAQRVISTSIFKALGTTTLDNIAEYADGNIDISGSKLWIINGSLFSANNIIINYKSEVTVSDKVSAGVGIVVHSNSNLQFSSMHEKVPDILMPAISFDAPTDSNSLKNKAINYGQLYTAKEFEELLQSNNDITLNNITYVTGDIEIMGNKNITVNGVLASDGNIVIGKRTTNCCNGIDCGKPNIAVLKTNSSTPSGILAKRTLNFESCLGEFIATGLIYANDQINILSTEKLIKVSGGIISRKLTISSAWTGVEITFDNDSIASVIGAPTFSPVITVEHWEEKY